MFLIQEGLLYGLMESPAVTGAQNYKVIELCLQVANPVLNTSSSNQSTKSKTG